MEQQRRGLRIAMTPAQIDAHLRLARTCRVASVGHGGAPHNSALWFVWDGTALWLYSIVKSQRWTNLERDPRVSVLVDGGERYDELWGLELVGHVEFVGPIPRAAGDDSDLAEPERLFGEKYAGGAFVPDGRHAWLRLVADKILSWDFTRLAQG